MHRVFFVTAKFPALKRDAFLGLGGGSATHLLRRDEEAVMVVLAADHHVPDGGAFRDAVVRAAR